MTVYPRFGVAAPAFVARLGFVLYRTHGAAGRDHVCGLLKGGNPHRKQAIEIHTPQRVVGSDRSLLLQDDRTLVKTVGGPEDGEPGTRVAADDGPVDGTGSPIAGQQRWVELNHAVAWNRDEILRHELKDVGHDAEVGVEDAQRLARLLGLQRPKLIERDAPLLGSHPQRIGSRARLLRGAEHPGDGIASIKESVEHGLAEISLSYNGNTHHEIPRVASFVIMLFVCHML